MTRVGRIAVVLSIAGVTLSAAPTAFAKIVVGQSIANVNLGDSKTSVQKHYGKGQYCDNNSCAYGGAFDGRITFDKHARVVDMFTGSCKQSTSKGIHAGGGCKHGSSLAQIKHAYPKAKCSTLAHSGGFSTCEMFGHFHGRKVDTTILIKSAAFGVAEIVIGFV